jgi:3-oxoacyl-[acyl-carrier protein] reductase
VKTCVVTGASQGIGSAIADKLRVNGFEVVGLSRHRPARWTGDYIECDLASSSSVLEAAEAIEKRQLWAIVNNAGFAKSDKIDALNWEQLQYIYSVNVVAPSILTSAAIRAMSDGGRVVNICSSTMLGKAERSGYASSKAALAALTRVWALEVADRGITVNAVSPGAVATEMIRHKAPVGSEAEAAILRSIPDGRLAEPDDIAEQVDFFVSTRSSHTTGQNVFVDGGGTLSRPDV